MKPPHNGESGETESGNNPLQEANHAKQVDSDQVSSDESPIERNVANQSGDKRTGEKSLFGRITRAVGLVASVLVIVPILSAATTFVVNWVWYDNPPFYEQQKLSQERKRSGQMSNLAGQHVEVGDKFLNAEEPEAAKSEYDKALQLDPGNAAAERGAFTVDVVLDFTHPAGTTTSISESKFTQQRLSLLMKEYPENTTLWAYQGVLLLPYSRKASVQAFQKAIELNPKNAFAYSQLGWIYDDQGKNDLSLKMAGKAYNSAPWRSIYENNLAYELQKAERYQDAIEVYEDLRYGDPEYLWAYRDLASVYRLTGNLQRSYSYGRQFIEMTADEHVMSLSRNETAEFDAGPHSDSVLLITDVQKKYYGYYDLALTSYLLGHEEQAESYVGKAKRLQLDPHAAAEVDRLLNYAIEHLQDKQNRFRAKADEFKAKFL